LKLKIFVDLWDWRSRDIQYVWRDCEHCILQWRKRVVCSIWKADRKISFSWSYNDIVLQNLSFHSMQLLLRIWYYDLQVLKQMQSIQWQKVSLMFMSWWCWAWCQSSLINMTWIFKIFNCIEYLFTIFKKTRLLKLSTIYDKSSFKILQKMISFADKYFTALLKCNDWIILICIFHLAQEIWRKHFQKI
jgi:hypothetical protein